ncbi:MAG: PhoH family protein [Schleiferiaceae bacterium]|nr:PhoH family protein [Schleiferiaceae bacterium]
MSEIEKTIELVDADPQLVYGTNNTYLKTLKSYYPKLKITARGNKIKVNGNTDQIRDFEEKINLILRFVMNHNHITENQLERIILDNSEEFSKSIDQNNDTLVHGVNGGLIKARTFNQKRMVEAIDKNDMLFAIGPAGTGKTYTGVALAVRALKNKEVKRIILTRPAVEAGENLGFLPGDLKDKLDPYLRPLYDALRDMITHDKLNYFIETGVIEIAPLAFMRGRTLDKSFVILDEAQNTTHSQMKMFLTRMGRSAKFIITGDITQIDLPHKQQSGLKESLRILKNVKGISRVNLDEKDIIRHKLVGKIVEAYDKNKNTDEQGAS